MIKHVTPLTTKEMMDSITGRIEEATENLEEQIDESNNKIKKNKESIDYNFIRIEQLQTQSSINRENIKYLKIDLYKHKINTLKLLNKIIIFSLINTLFIMLCMIGLLVETDIITCIFASIGLLIASGYMAYTALNNHSDIMILKKELNRLMYLDLEIRDANKEDK